MNGDIILELELIEQAAWGYCFRLRIENRSAVRLFVPTLKITDLRFHNSNHAAPLEWLTSMLVSGSSGGSAIESGATLQRDFDVRPCAVTEGSHNSPSGWDYNRWCLRLLRGEYSVWYDLLVDQTYFNSESHYRFGQIEELAKRNNATLWRGSVQSNVLSVYHA